MANTTPKKRKLRAKPVQTVRQRSEKHQNAKPKTRRLRKTASAASKPFIGLWVIIKKIARPFGFIIRPFKTRPVRFIGRVLYKLFFVGYFVGAWHELRQVTWPSGKETRQLTFAVFAFAVVFGLVVTAVDYGLDKVFKKIFLN